MRPHFADACGQGARGRTAAGTGPANAAAIRSRTRSWAISPMRRESTARKRSPRRTPSEAAGGGRHSVAPPKRFDLGRLWAYARRETLSFCATRSGSPSPLFGPIILMFAFGYGISFDIEHLKYAAFDQDDTPESRQLLDGFSSSRYFSEQPPVGIRRPKRTAGCEAEPCKSSSRFRAASAAISKMGTRTEVDASVDGAMTFRGETAKNYVNGVVRRRGTGDSTRLRSDTECGATKNRDALSLQPGLPERQRHGAGRLHADALSHPRDHVGYRGRAREGDRVHRQFPFDADHQVRIPLRQAASLCRHRDGEFRLPVSDGGFHFPRAGQGAISDAAAGNLRLRGGDDRFRPADFFLYPHAGRRGVRDSHPFDCPGGEFFRTVRTRYRR